MLIVSKFKVMFVGKIIKQKNMKEIRRESKRKAALKRFAISTVSSWTTSLA